MSFIPNKKSNEKNLRKYVDVNIIINSMHMCERINWLYLINWLDWLDLEGSIKLTREPRDLRWIVTCRKFSRAISTARRLYLAVHLNFIWRSFGDL